MNFRVLMLADHAVVSDGLLYINGGCANVISRPEYPTPLGLMLAAAIMVPVDRLGKPFRFSVTVRAADNDRILVRVEGEMVSGMKEGADPLSLANPLVIDLRGAPIPAPGNYMLEARVADAEAATLYFTAVEENSTA